MGCKLIYNGSFFNNLEEQKAYLEYEYKFLKSLNLEGKDKLIFQARYGDEESKKSLNNYKRTPVHLYLNGNSLLNLFNGDLKEEFKKVDTEPFSKNKGSYMVNFKPHIDKYFGDYINDEMILSKSIKKDDIENIYHFKDGKWKMVYPQNEDVWKEKFISNYKKKISFNFGGKSIEAIAYLKSRRLKVLNSNIFLPEHVITTIFDKIDNKIETYGKNYILSTGEIVNRKTLELVDNNTKSLYDNLETKKRC